MKILSFDQASRTTGYAVIEDDRLIEHNKFTFEDSDFGDRLLNIRNKVQSLVEYYKPDKVLFEDIQLQENVETFKKLAEVFGVIEELLTEMEVPHEAVLASSWKSALGIKGKDRTEQKRNAAAWVQLTYAIKPTQDECDAICLGNYYFSKSKQPKVYDWS